MQENIQEFVSNLLTNSERILEPVTEQNADLLKVQKSFDDSFKNQWLFINHSYLITYTDDDGNIHEVYLISKETDDIWSIETISGKKVKIAGKNMNLNYRISFYEKIASDSHKTNKSNKELFIDAVLYSNKKVIADDEEYQHVQLFIDLQDPDYFNETELYKILEHYGEFLEA